MENELTTAEAAELTDVSEATLRALAKTNRIAARKTESGEWRFPPSVESAVEAAVEAEEEDEDSEEDSETAQKIGEEVLDAAEEAGRRAAEGGMGREERQNRIFGR